MKRDKAKKDMSKGNILIWFMGLMGKRLPVYLLAIVLSTAGWSGSKIANAWLIKSIMAAVQTKETDGLLWQIALNCLMIAAALFAWRFGIIRYNIEAKRGIARVEKQVFAKALRLPFSYYENNHSSDFMSRLIFDMEKAGDIYGSRFRRLADAVLSTVIFMMPMLFLNWRLTLCLFAVSGMSLIVNGLFVKPMKTYGKELSVQNGVVTEKITNILAGMEITRIFSTGRQLLDAYDTANEECYKIQKKTNRMTAFLESFNSFFDLLSSLAFLGVGVWFLSKQLTNLGELAAIYAIYGSFRMTVAEIGKYIPQMMNCIANAERIRDFLKMTEEPSCYPAKTVKMPETALQNAVEKTVKTAQTEDIVTAEKVSYAYEAKLDILKDFSLHVHPGEFVALTGKSGCGKSTFAKLLLGFYNTDAGVLSLENNEYSSMTLQDIRNKIGYVPQEPYLFQVSIAENIAYGRSGNGQDFHDVPMGDIIEAAKAANAHDFIMKLPNGYQTVPGERGNTLSGGEKQRIAIARAVLKNAPVLLLDEATSALDNESERLVNEAIERLCENCTTIMIAHRTSTIERADRVVAMDCLR